MHRLQRLLKILRWKAIHRGKRRDITLQTWNGLLTCDSKDWLIGKYLYVNGSYEQEAILTTVGFLRSEGLLIRDDGIVLDVGANIGMIAIALLKHHLFERAAAFEPDPDNYRLLVKNVLQNGLQSQVLTFPLGLSSPDVVGDGNGVECTLERSPDNFGDHRIRHTAEPGFFHEENRSVVTVRVKTLDQVLEDSPNLRPEEITVVWLDIQGHEGHFFDGARKLLQRQIPVVSEFWPYGIVRSGMPREKYLQIAESVFTHFYYLDNFKSGHFPRKPIAELSHLFDLLKSPRSGGQIILTRE
jgi:FkbM family methyltransferase